MLKKFAPKINLKIAWIYTLGNVSRLQLHLYGFIEFKIELHGFTFTHPRLGIYIYTNVNERFYIYKEVKKVCCLKPYTHTTLI